MDILHVTTTILSQIHGDHGSIWHLLRSDSSGYFGFGEAYITTVNQMAVKGWKCHERMVLNLIVLEGRVKFVYREAQESIFTETIISSSNLSRLTVPPKTLFAFQGMESRNIILNLASIPHDPSEVESVALESHNYANW